MYQICALKFDVGWIKIAHEGCALSQYSKPYLLFSATDAVLAAIDFSKRNIDNRVVDSPSNQGPPRSPMVATSPLSRSSFVLHRHLSPLSC